MTRSDRHTPARRAERPRIGAERLVVEREGSREHGLPATAAWRHFEARDGFEVVFFTTDHSGCLLEGYATAVEGREAWVVRYAISLDQRWVTAKASIWSRSPTGQREVVLESNGAGGWRVDGETTPEIDGCFDVDLEYSACTNTLPVHRLHLQIGQSAMVPAAYVRASDLRVERLEQHYIRLDDEDDRERYGYRALAFDYDSELGYDRAGLVIEYPGLATRVR